MRNGYGWLRYVPVPGTSARPGRVALVRVSRPAGDTGEADPAVTAALAAYAAGRATERAVLAAVTATRLLVPVVAVLTEAGEDGAEKESEMALPTLIGNDGRKAVIAFTGTESLKLWREDARPVPVTARDLWPAVSAERADAVVIDVAGPVQLVVEGARLAALAVGEPPPPPHEDPDVRAAVAAVTSDFALAPGAPDVDLVITVTAAGEPEARALAGELARLLYPRLRRVEFQAVTGRSANNSKK